jgi:hypothetical protein
VRRFAVLLTALPPESAVQAELRGRPWYDEWTIERELLAQLVELASVAATEKHRLKKPVEVPRPKRTGKDKAVSTLSPGDAARRLMAVSGKVTP